jgi:hypothetical protein
MSGAEATYYLELVHLYDAPKKGGMVFLLAVYCMNILNQ